MSNSDEDRVFTHEQGENLLTRQEQIRNELAGIRNTLNKHFGVEPALMLDGTKAKYYAVMQQFFAEHLPENWTKADLTAVVDSWYKKTRLAWDGFVDFYNPSLSAVSTGTRGGDMAGMVCETSTNTTAGRDDFAALPLFAPIDCNWEIDATTKEPIITAIDGITDNFERYNPEKLVGVLQQSGYVYEISDASRWRLGYTAKFVPYVNIRPLPESVRPSDNKMREWVLHAKYMNRTENSKATCYSGKIPTAFNINHNSMQTLAANTMTGLSGTCFCDWSFLRLMFHLKYASLAADGILQGCLSNNVTAKAAVSETGVKRILLSGTPAIEKGMGVLLGAINSSGTEINRSATNYNISGAEGCIVTDVESVTVEGTAYTAVYVDTSNTFDTVAGTTCIATFHWPNGSCDNILGNDGSPASPGGGKYAAKLQGIEYSVGTYEVVTDTIQNLYKDENDNYLSQAYMVSSTAKQATSITNDYEAIGSIFTQPASAGYLYPKKMGLFNGMLFPVENGGSTSTYYKDGWYYPAHTVTTREFLLFGHLANGVGSCGLSYAYVNYGLPYASWLIASRPSPNGNRGEWAA